MTTAIHHAGGLADTPRVEAWIVYWTSYEHGAPTTYMWGVRQGQYEYERAVRDITRQGYEYAFSIHTWTDSAGVEHAERLMPEDTPVMGKNELLREINKYINTHKRGAQS